MSDWNPERERQEEGQDQVLTQEENGHTIVLYNDDVNTFDHVILSLIQICEHTEEQASQCALIVHHKGKCDVKTGVYSDLEPQCSALLQRGLSAEIQ